MGTKAHNNYEDLLTFTRASKGHALRPVSYGDELVTNHDFSDGSTGWTVANTDATHTVTFSNGGARFQSDTSSPILTLTSAVVLDSTKIYKLEVVISAATSGFIKIDGAGVNQTYSSTGTHTAIITTTSASGNNVISFYRQGTNVDITFDSVSVKEVLFDQPDGTLTLFEHPNNIPRVEYDADGNRLGLLVEEQRTNLLPYSEDFSNAQWGKSYSVAVSPSSETAPNGQEVAYELTGIESSDGDAGMSEFTSASGSTTYTGTIWFKAKNTSDVGKYVRLRLKRNGGAFVAQSESVQLTNSWVRHEVTLTLLSDNTGIGFIITKDTAQNTVDRADECLIYGAQLEEASFPTSYIKSNSGSTTTRSADVASIPVADFGYNTAVGSIVAEVGAHNTDSNLAAHYTISKTSIGSEWVSTYSSGTGVAFRVREGGSDQGVITISNDIRTSGAKTGFAFKEDDFAAVVNGGTVSTDTAGSMASGVEELKIAGFGSNPRQLCGHIKSIKYYPRRLTNAQLQDITL